MTGKVLAGACLGGLLSCGWELAGGVILVGRLGATGLFSAGGVSFLLGKTRVGSLFFSGVIEGLLLFTGGSSLSICGF